MATTTFISKPALRRWLQQWEQGRTKNDIEREELGDVTSHGKYITRLWREHLGVETENEHPLVTENRRLRNALRSNGINPEDT
jgi:hypothetical protein